MNLSRISNRPGLSQEGLKLVACVTMLIDHIGALFVPGIWLRCIGRLSFPIFCFLIAEGAVHTRDPKKYALRMLIGAVLAELPYDFAFYGGIHWQKQSVMVTLLWGFLVIWVLQSRWEVWLRLLCAAVMVYGAAWLRADYGRMGVILIVMFYLTRELPYALILQGLGMLALFTARSSRVLYSLGPLELKLQMLGVLAIVPIALYSGKKRTASKAAQWGFYLFYPGHLAVLYLLILSLNKNV